MSFTTSVIIPAYNEEKQIVRCIERVSNSGGNYLEIIVVDNNSTDNTSNAARAYVATISSTLGHPEIKVFTESRKGVTRARQKGALEARGDLLVFLDADNTMPKEWYGKMIAEFEKDPKLACLSGTYFYDDVTFLMRLLVSIYWHLLAYPTYISLGYMAVAGNLVIKKEVLEKMGGLDTSIEFYGDDTDTARRARQFGHMKFSLGLIMNSSGRRLMQQGLFNTAWNYLINFFSQVFIHRPVTTKYQDFR